VGISLLGFSRSRLLLSPQGRGSDRGSTLAGVPGRAQGGGRRGAGRRPGDRVGRAGDGRWPGHGPYDRVLAALCQGRPHGLGDRANSLGSGKPWGGRPRR